MCEYCETRKKLKDVDDRDIDNGAYAFVDDDDKELSIALGEFDYITGEGLDELYINIPINYCPMCGRDLNEA